MAQQSQQQQQPSFASTNQMFQPNNKTVYTIVVKTSDLFDASTHANVYVSLIGTLGSSPAFQLQNSINHRVKFQRNHSDVFVFPDIQSLGDLKEVRVLHDNTGPSPGWHLELVEVHDAAANLIYTFPCQRWLDKTEDDGHVCRVLPLARKRAHTPRHFRQESTGQASTLQLAEQQPISQFQMSPMSPNRFLDGYSPPPPPPNAPLQLQPPFSLPPQQIAQSSVIGSSQQAGIS